MEKKNWFVCPDCGKSRDCKQGCKHVNYDIRTWHCKCGNKETEIVKK